MTLLLVVRGDAWPLLLCLWGMLSRAAGVFATPPADAAGQASQLWVAAVSDMARMRSCAGALASAWLTAQPGLAELAAVESVPPAPPLRNLIQAVSKAWYCGPPGLEAGQRRVGPEHHCSSNRKGRVASPNQNCVGEGSGRQARGCREVFAETAQPHDAVPVPVREVHLRPLLVSEASYTADVAHATDERVPDPAQRHHQQVTPSGTPAVGLAVLLAAMQHALILSALQAAARPACVSWRQCCPSAAGHAVL